MAKYYPIYLHIRDKKCVVVGGGKVAWRKVCSLREAGARVTVVAPDICAELSREEGVEIIKQKYDESFLKEAMIVIASTDDEQVNTTVYSDAMKRGLLVNVVDRPEFCSFIVPSSIERGDLRISISTGGASPALARNIRKSLEGQFGKEYCEFTRLLSEMRKKVLVEVRNESIRRDILQRIAGLDFLEVIKKDGPDVAQRRMLDVISEKCPKE
ncbi:MAG: bifunctional precorrin-2 dehydrogenase/sirohydrochlorin ferrochelatase [Candidatus Brocadiaceae bacterium]|nr:bifunctional precorrin-2 dehydrogenase/sirohydrochlorin ferrochelatase [Candidatus Brocadiaceae bacterium]